MSTIQERIEVEVGRVITNTNNWPPRIARHMLGRDLATPIAKIALALEPIIREAQAQVLTEFADAHRIPTPMFQGKTMTITVNDLLRAKAEELRSPPITGPDCLAKKCRACDGRALDLTTDEIIHCQCTCHKKPN